jgi:hypothetical protein
VAGAVTIDMAVETGTAFAIGRARNLDIADLAVNSAWIARITASIVYYAGLVGEAYFANIDPPTSAEKARYLLAVEVVRAPDAWAPTFAWVVAATAGITVDSTDDELNFYVGSNWNLVAQVPKG